MPHKFGRKLLEMDVRGTRTILQDKTNKGFSLDECRISNFGTKIFKLKSIVITKSLSTRVQLKL